MLQQHADQFNLSLMCPTTNTDPHQTAFMITVDHVSCTTGVSASDRALTMRGLASKSSHAGTMRRPGHVFPLLARQGGLLERAGHTEAAVGPCRIHSHPFHSLILCCFHIQTCPF